MPLHILWANLVLLLVVPLYDSLGESAVEYTVNHSETSIVFAEASKLEFIAKAASAIKKSVKHVVYWGSHATVEGSSSAIKKEASPILCYSLPLLSATHIAKAASVIRETGKSIGVQGKR